MCFSNKSDARNFVPNGAKANSIFTAGEVATGSRFGNFSKLLRSKRLGNGVLIAQPLAKVD